MIHNVKIAVVDDSELTRNLLVDVLMFCVNRKVLSFDSALAAWEYFQNDYDTDLIISDVSMTGMSGLELLAKIKHHHPRTICVIMSGDPASEKIARAMGADAFLAKPFNINDLFEIVQTFVVGEP